MPFISIIIPVYSVQGYLRECLDSILDQPATGPGSFTDIEVIAVDDHSPDHCPAILEEYAAADPRVRVLHLSANAGLGPARNIGLDQARGDYVWFVDSDDRLAPGALPAIAARLRQTLPDVLLIDHTRVGWLGTQRGSTGRGLLRALEESPCGPLAGMSQADQGGLLSLFTVAWNKVVRREFLCRTGIRFDVGWYEDLPFTYPVLVAADRIATLGRVCYHYRQRRTDAITRTCSERHFEVFDQWSRVFERLDALGHRAAPYRSTIFERMLWHLLVVQSIDDRLPASSRRRFFHQISGHYHHYRRANLPHPAADPQAPDESTATIVRTHQSAPSRLDRLRRRLVAADAYRWFRALRAVRLAARTVRGWVRRVARRLRRTAAGGATLVRSAAGRLYYHVQRRRPIEEDLAVYAAYWYRGFSCNPAAIYAKARELAPGVRGVWAVQRDRAATMPAAVPYVVAGSWRYYRALARARWLINNVNFPDFVVKRVGSTHLQTHHGTPVKVMGLDQTAFPVGAQGVDLTAMMRRCDRWDLSLSSNPHTTEVWSRAYPCRYTTLEYGYPRNDRLALAGPRQVAHARALLDLHDGQLVVLYAPTFREYLSGFNPLLDIDAFAEALGHDVRLLVRTHYLYPDRYRHNAPTYANVQDVSTHPNVEDLLLASDVLVTDYSSVMFDFGVLDRPIVIYAPDWDAYRRTRGVTFDLLAEPPGVVTTTQADLVDAFRTGTVDDDAATKARSAFRARFCALDDGYAAERVVRRLFAGQLRPGGVLARAPDGSDREPP